MKKKLTKKAEKLLWDSFSWKGKAPAFSGISTDHGTAPLWGQLVLAGLVRQTGGGLGHYFNYELTPEGNAFLTAMTDKQSTLG